MAEQAGKTEQATKLFRVYRKIVLTGWESTRVEASTHEEAIERAREKETDLQWTDFMSPDFDACHINECVEVELTHVDGQEEEEEIGEHFEGELCPK
jgi:flavin-binding protein dodecin